MGKLLPFNQGRSHLSRALDNADEATAALWAAARDLGMAGLHGEAAGYAALYRMCVDLRRGLPGGTGRPAA